MDLLDIKDKDVSKNTIKRSYYEQKIRFERVSQGSSH